MAFRRYKKLELNGADWARVEAALRLMQEQGHAAKTANSEGLRAIARTLDKVERINGTGDYTLQWPGGPTLREKQQFYARRGAK